MGQWSLGGAWRRAVLVGVCAMGVVLCAAPSTGWSQDDEGDDASDVGVTEAAEGGDAAEGEGDEDAVFVGVTPTSEGATGLFHTVSAQSGGVGTYRLGLFGQYFSGSDVVRTNDENTRFVGTLAFSATPLEWLEPYVVLMARSNSNTFGTPETVLAQGDSQFGAKGIYGIDEVFHVGLDLRAIVLTGAGNTTFDFSAASVKIAALGTFDATKLSDPLPLKAHLNLGYFADNSDQLLPEDATGAKLIPSRVERFAQGVSAFDQFTVRLGVEAPFAYVTPHIEYNLGILMGDEPAALCEDQPLACPSGAGFGGNPQTLTLGVKGAPVEGLILNGGVDIGLTSEDVQGVPTTAPYNVMLGLAYVIDPAPKVTEKIVERVERVEVPPPRGWVQGSVVDKDTKKPIPGAMIAYKDGAYTTQATDSKKGTFRSYEVGPKDVLELSVSAPNYKTKAVKQALKEGENMLVVELEPEGDLGTISGKVTMNGKPYNGKVLLTGPKTYTTLAKDGEFSQRVLVGDYTVSGTAQGMMTAGKDVSLLRKGAKTRVAFALKPRPADAQVSVSGTKILVEGRLAFDKEGNLDPSSEGLLDQVASLLFERPGFRRVRVESHVDNKTGGRKEADREAFTQKRASAVRAYLVKAGVSSKRLEAKGFGSSQPLVPNTTPADREINRRVEFTIVSQSKR